MTGGAKFRRSIGAVGNDRRHMRLVAYLAVLYGHLSGMGLVALRTCGYLAVNAAMARGAEERRMFALVVAKLLDLRHMAGKTGIRQIGCQGDRKGSMRIRMAAEASLEVKVRFALMALVALGNVVL